SARPRSTARILKRKPLNRLRGVPHGPSRSESSRKRTAKSAAENRMTERTYNVLFLCTGNSARSILAESYLNSVGRGRFRAYSAGSHPTGKVNPFALELLEHNRITTEGLGSKAWEEFAR